MPNHTGRAERVGLLGGTFDPIHVGHLVIAEAARCELGLDRVIFVPANVQPFKLGRPCMPPAHRLEMVRLAIVGNEHFEVSTVELDREPPSYTADTLHILVEEAAAAGVQREFFFVCGADALFDMHRWHHPEEVLRHATVAAAQRPGHGDQAAVAVAAARLSQAYGGRVVSFAAPRLDVSSTEIRDRWASGRGVRYLVPEAAYAYALAHGLYITPERDNL